MNNFTMYTPTEVIFGRETEKQTGEVLARYGGSRVFLVYGGGSVVKSGLLSRVEASLEEAGLTFFEFGGAMPNPRLEHAEEGVRRALEFRADFILAVGGGSAIDTAKGIAHGAANPDLKLWDIWTGKAALTRSLPVASVLTIPAAGSEMSDSAVLTNESLGVKAGINTVWNRAKFAIMNPELCYSLPKYQLAAGITDIMMHTMERYFIPGIQADLTDEIAEGLLRTVVRNGRIAMKNTGDYDSMAEIMWASSLSHNGLTEAGRGKDFSVHKLGHALSAKFDVTHGASLAACWGAWAKYLSLDAKDRFARFARRVWGIENPCDTDAIEEGIRATLAFFSEIGMPTSIPDILGRPATREEITEMALLATQNDSIRLSRIRPLGAHEVEEIYERANM